jgi:hypothetical protein
VALTQNPKIGPAVLNRVVAQLTLDRHIFLEIVRKGSGASHVLHAADWGADGLSSNPMPGGEAHSCAQRAVSNLVRNGIEHGDEAPVTLVAAERAAYGPYRYTPPGRSRKRSNDVERSYTVSALIYARHLRKPLNTMGLASR